MEEKDLVIVYDIYTVTDTVFSILEGDEIDNKPTRANKISSGGFIIYDKKLILSSQTG